MIAFKHTHELLGVTLHYNTGMQKYEGWMRICEDKIMRNKWSSLLLFAELSCFSVHIEMERFNCAPVTLDNWQTEQLSAICEILESRDPKQG